MILTYTWLVLAISVLALYFRHLYSKLSRNGVNHLPTVPLFGSLFWVFIKKEHMIELLMRTINTFPEDKIIGHYDMVNPVLIIRDTELLKQITIKDFEYFVDRRRFTTQYDRLFGRGLLLLTGDEWKAMRATMSPAFTSSKIRLMFPFMIQVGEEMNKAFRQKIQASGTPYIDVETKDIMTRFANDVIATCAFGLEVNSQAEDNEFYAYTKSITSFKIVNVLKIFFYRRFPYIAQMLKLSLAEQEAADFLSDVILSTMENRQKNNIIRHDMINLLMEVKKGQLNNKKESLNTDGDLATSHVTNINKKQLNIEWTDTDLIAQAALFLFAGFDTISTAMSFLLYEMAINPDVQDKLVREIKEYEVKNGGKLDCNTIQDMVYLDMVISEGLRLWPAVILTDRRCVKDYNISKPNSQTTKDLIVHKDEIVVIPILAFHRDPKLFPEPLKFDPERFSPENKDKIKPLTYMPFGLGPRNCIGSRFALCEMKVMLYSLLREMELYPCEKTCFPPKLSNDGFNIQMDGGCWIRVRVRPEK